MKVLFISREPKHFKTIPFIETQYQSLKIKGIDIDHYVIKNKFIKGYLEAYLFLLRNKNNYDIIHAHYAHCFFPLFFSFPKAKKIISFMGSDLYGIIGRVTPYKMINIYLAKIVAGFADRIIVKSAEMEKLINRKYHNKVSVIPNGVDCEINKPVSKKVAADRLKLSPEGKYLLFLGDKKDPRKNYKLLDKVSPALKEFGLTILSPSPVGSHLVPYYINISEVIALTSLKEGSPNIIKESMACNRPIVATNVGDIKWLYGNEPGHFLTDFTTEDLINKIKQALNYSEKYGNTQGRKRIMELGLDNNTTAEKIINLYQEVLNNG